MKKHQIGLVLLSLASGLFFLSWMAKSHTRSPSSSPIKIVREKLSSSPYSSPAKNKANFYAIYDTPSLQYDVTPLKVIVDETASYGDGNVFEITYYNFTAQSITPSLSQMSQLDIGCIATLTSIGYNTIKEDPSIFNKKVWRNPANINQQITSFPPGKTKLQIEVQPSCKYIGTADLNYYWQVK